METFFADHAFVRWALAAILVIALPIAVRSMATRHPSLHANYATSREAEAGHVAMSLDMLAMLVAPLGSVPHILWRWIFGGIALTYAALLTLRITRRELSPAVGAGYHMVAALAMVYATLESECGRSMPTTSMPEMMRASGPPYPVIGWVLAGLFVFDAVGTAVIAARHRGIRIPVIPHVVMDIVMAAMIVAAVS
jgi:hypothetical protein